MMWISKSNNNPSRVVLVGKIEKYLCIRGCMYVNKQSKMCVAIAKSDYYGITSYLSTLRSDGVVVVNMILLGIL